MELKNLTTYSAALREKARAFDALASAIDDAFSNFNVNANSMEAVAPALVSSKLGHSAENPPQPEMPETVAATTDVVLRIQSTQPQGGLALVDELRRRLAAGEFGRAKEFAGRMNVSEFAVREAVQSPGSGIVFRHGWLKLSHVATQPTSLTSKSASPEGKGLTVDTLRELVAINPAPVNQIARECSVSDSDVLNLVQQPGSNLVIFHGKVMSASAIK